MTPELAPWFATVGTAGLLIGYAVGRIAEMEQSKRILLALRRLHYKAGTQSF